jgi:hypothetical protein
MPQVYLTTVVGRVKLKLNKLTEQNQHNCTYLCYLVCPTDNVWFPLLPSPSPLAINTACKCDAKFRIVSSGIGCPLGTHWHNWVLYLSYFVSHNAHVAKKAILGCVFNTQLIAFGGESFQIHFQNTWVCTRRRNKYLQTLKVKEHLLLRCKLFLSVSTGASKQSLSLFCCRTSQTVARVPLGGGGHA